VSELLDSNSSGYVVIVDDRPETLQMLSVMFLTQGYKVQQANSGQQALARIFSDPPDLVLLDINLPEMNGYEVCDKLKATAETRDIPIIFMSALDNVVDKLEAFAVGGIDYVSKPFQLAEVLARVDTHIKLRRTQIELQQRAKQLHTQNTILQGEACDAFGVTREFYGDLLLAIENQEFELYYQPIVEFEDQRIIGFETLIRWQHPQRGMISPLDFIPLAEVTGLINPIGKWVVQEACKQLSIWHQQFPQHQDLSLTINVSGKQLMDNSLVKHVETVLQQTSIDPNKLKIEITESSIMLDPDLGLDILRQLKNLGIQLYIDDFGSGYSSLSRLYDFPFDGLKIDQSFVMNGKWVLVNAITMLAITLDKEVIAEGIETSEQLETLKILACKQGQGYFFSRPVDAKKATELIAATVIPKIV
jgi:diguanylate cyclase